MLQDEPQKLWIPERDKFLKEFIRLEGRGDATLYQACQGLPGCLNAPVVRCRDCEGSQLYCQGCIVVQHTVMPLHHMEVCLISICIYLIQYSPMYRYGPVRISSAFHSVILATVSSLATLQESSVVTLP